MALVAVIALLGVLVTFRPPQLGAGCLRLPLRPAPFGIVHNRSKQYSVHFRYIVHPHLRQYRIYPRGRFTRINIDVRG